MRVWIDQEQCTSSGLCEVIASDVFVIRDDGLAHLREGQDSGDGVDGRVTYHVRADQEDVVREAAAQCPGECIHLQD